MPSLLGIDQDDPNAIDPKKVRACCAHGCVGKGCGWGGCGGEGSRRGCRGAASIPNPNPNPSPSPSPSPSPKPNPHQVDPKKLLRMDAKDVVQKAQQEIHHLKGNFLVVVLTDPEEPPKKDEDPVISIDLTDTRESFLSQCQQQHLQFNTLRHAQYSTMMILQHIHNKLVKGPRPRTWPWPQP